MFQWRKEFSTKNHRIYLDHAAATPVRNVVREAMEAVNDEFANASAIHAEGVQARQVIEGARASLARCLKVRPEGVTFTGSGTESNNIAILGTIYARHNEGRSYSDMEIISTKLEHPSVAATLEFAASLGVQVTYIDVSDTGLINFEDLKEKLSERTVLVTTAYINSEIGVRQPLNKIARIVRKFEADHGTHICVHADGAQAPYWETCQLDRIGVDMLSLDSAKCGGPKGVGVLVRRHGVEVSPVLFGGPQEAGIRPATENTVGIVGAVVAITSAQEVYEETSERTVALRNDFLKALRRIPDVVLNGDVDARVANNLNVSVLGVDGEFLTISLDAAGIAASTKSACSGASGGGSEVVRSISNDDARAQSTLRLTLGPDTAVQEIDQAVTIITKTIDRLRVPVLNV